MANIEICGARANNLKNISLSIPKNSLTVISGPSGSGKTSLALAVIAKESSRRLTLIKELWRTQTQEYSDSRSQVDAIHHLPPVLSLSARKRFAGNHTLGSLLGIDRWLALALPYLASQRCAAGHGRICAHSRSQIREALYANHTASKRLVLLARISTKHESAAISGLVDLQARGYTKFAVNGTIVDADEVFTQQKQLLFTTERESVAQLMIDGFDITLVERSRLEDSLDLCLAMSDTLGVAELNAGKLGTISYYSTFGCCPVCGVSATRFPDGVFDFRIGSKDITHVSLTYNQVMGANRMASEQLQTFLSTELEKLSIGALLSRELGEIEAWLFSLLNDAKQNLPNADWESLSYIAEQCRLLNALDLSHLTLLHAVHLLSRGEQQRLRIAQYLSAPLKGAAYIFDEPRAGLHSSETTILINQLIALRDKGNTIILIDNDPSVIYCADHSIVLGPAGGQIGGEVVYSGAPCKLDIAMRNLADKRHKKTSTVQFNKLPYLKLCGVRTKNLKDLSFSIPLNSIVAITGPSGSGKSTLLVESLYPALKAKLKKKGSGSKDSAQQILSLECDLPEKLKHVVLGVAPYASQTSRSTVASYLGIYQELQRLFASLVVSKMRGYTAQNFSLSRSASASGPGRCLACNGTGFDLDTKQLSTEPCSAPEVCDSCQGARFAKELLDVRFKGRNISDLLQMSLNEAAVELGSIGTISSAFKECHRFRLQYLPLGQLLYTLSHGEMQRLTLLNHLSKHSTATLFLLDEPSLGLCHDEIESLGQILKETVAAGNSVIFVDHTLELIANSDYVIDLGPGAGSHGGEVIFAGTPDNLAKCDRSITGRMLRRILQ